MSNEHKSAEWTWDMIPALIKAAEAANQGIEQAKRKENKPMTTERLKLQAKLGSASARRILASEQPKPAGHTPGPWMVGNAINAEPNEIPIYSDDRWLASAYANDNEIDSECEANARLIAAAPDLLAFAREFVRVMENPQTTVAMPHTVAQARTAIAKASGASATVSPSSARKSEGRAQ